MIIIDDVDSCNCVYHCIDTTDGECMRTYDTLEGAKSFQKGWNSVDKRTKMEEDFEFFVECTKGRKIDPMDRFQDKVLTKKDLIKARDALAKASVPEATNYMCITPDCTFSLGDCKPAPTTPPPIGWSNIMHPFAETSLQQQGNNPMAYDTKTTVAAATIISAQSDESRQREYLLAELAQKTDRTWTDPMYDKLKEQFNLEAPVIPQTSQGILDAFKNGKFTVDQAKVDRNTKFFADGHDSYDDEDGNNYVGSRYFGITFTDLPVEDHKGYHAAVKAYEKLKSDTKRAIIVRSPADGLQALIDLENWTPPAGTIAS